VPRKQAATLEEARNEIKHQYKRGPKRERKVTSEAALTEFEREVKREVACYLKAIDFSYNYIADSLGISTNVVKKWFQEEEMQARHQEILTDIVSGAIKLLKSYALEIIESLMTIFRTTNDEKLAKEIGFELLDRLGISKVNKSESKMAQEIRETHEHNIDITDKTGFMQAMEHAPPEVQAQVAEHFEAALSLAAEHTEKAVTHG
jgi:hypothetical protein